VESIGGGVDRRWSRSAVESIGGVVHRVSDAREYPRMCDH